MLLQAILFLWIMSVFMIQFDTLPVLLILSNAGSSSTSCRTWITQTPALVNLRRRSFIMIKFSRTVPHAIAYKQLKTLSSTCNVLLSSFLVRSNRTTLQTWVYRVFNHANCLIKTRHSHSLCSIIFWWLFTVIPCALKHHLKGQFPITHRICMQCDFRSPKSKDIWLTRLLMIDIRYQGNYSMQWLFLKQLVLKIASISPG